jgi:hypothetical protein
VKRSDLIQKVIPKFQAYNPHSFLYWVCFDCVSDIYDDFFSLVCFTAGQSENHFMISWLLSALDQYGRSPFHSGNNSKFSTIQTVFWKKWERLLVLIFHKEPYFARKCNRFVVLDMLYYMHFVVYFYTST